MHDGRILSWSDEKTLRLWSAEGDPLKMTDEHKESVEGALELRDGRFLSWSVDKTLRLWSAKGDPLKVLEGHEGSVRNILVLHDGGFCRGRGIMLYGCGVKTATRLK